MSSESSDRYSPGLEGVVANETAIANVEGQGGAGGLEYRGYRIEDLAAEVSFVETAFLLLHGDLPGQGQLREFDERLRANRGIPETLTDLYRKIPTGVHPMDILRTSVSVLSHFDPEVNASPRDHAANVRKAERLLAQVPTAIAVQHRISRGEPVIPPRADLDHPANFLNMVNGRTPSASMSRAFDVSLILYTEHELNASTFSARVTVSTLADFYSGIVAAVGTLKGPLHGGANEEAWKVLEQVGSPENAERWIQDALKKGERIMGFGHRVYKNYDPRAAIVKQTADGILESLGANDELLDLAKQLEDVALHDEYFIERKLYPNVDFYTGLIYKAMGFPTKMFTVLFAIGRLPGWIAQWREMIQDPATKIGRPRQVYTGYTARDYVPGGRR